MENTKENDQNKISELFEWLLSDETRSYFFAVAYQLAIQFSNFPSPQHIATDGVDNAMMAIYKALMNPRLPLEQILNSEEKQGPYTNKQVPNSRLANQVNENWGQRINFTALRSYMIVVVKNAVRQEFRKTKRELYTLSDSDTDIPLDELQQASSSPEGQPDKFVSAAETIDAIKDALMQLPVLQRKAIQMRYFGNYSSSQIADELGITHSHVYSLISRARNNLRKKLSRDSRVEWPY